MPILHTNCTASRARERQCQCGLQRFAHITHIFYKYYNRHYINTNIHPKVTCENAVQAVQIAVTRTDTSLHLQSTVCAMVYKMHTKPHFCNQLNKMVTLHLHHTKF